MPVRLIGLETLSCTVEGGFWGDIKLSGGEAMMIYLSSLYLSSIGIPVYPKRSKQINRILL